METWYATSSPTPYIQPSIMTAIAQQEIGDLPQDMSECSVVYLPQVQRFADLTHAIAWISTCYPGNGF